ncbi:MAG: 3-oxoacyl-(acyl-carrier-protein) synthase [Bacteroidota bacterium]|nr:3-oxoacyl-(acyl-carrier-protein) synthase [Bacteroidota bacterium]
MKASIHSTSYYLPPGTLSNSDLCELFPQLTEKDIYKRTGINNRHITSTGVVGSDLGFNAAIKLFEENNIDRSQIDYLIFCTEGLDYKGPATACILQHRLGLNQNCGAIDLPFGCTGFTYCLSVAKGLIESEQASSVLIITSDIPSTVIHPDDSELRMIFGDAGAATLVVAKEASDIGVGRYSFGTDGSGAENLMVERSGTRNPANAEWFQKNEAAGGMVYGQMKMNSVEIFTFALRVVPPMIADILEKNMLNKNDIDLFIFHQANAFLLSVLRRKLKIEEDKFFICMENVGNTVSASIPIALNEAIKKGKIKSGNKVLLASFGIGYSWSGTVVTF